MSTLDTAYIFLVQIFSHTRRWLRGNYSVDVVLLPVTSVRAFIRCLMLAVSSDLTDPYLRIILIITA